MNESTDLSPESLSPAESLLQRYVDGELDSAERRRFEERLQDDPAARASLEEFESTRSLLRSASADPVVVPSDFRSRIVDQVRGRVPDSLESEEPESGGWASGPPASSAGSTVVAHRVASWGIRVVCAAALLLAACAAFAFGWFDQAESGDLSASPNQLQNEMEALDAEIEADRAAAERNGSAGRSEPR
ncbi:MAG: hypothetical protein AAF196_19150 [Planctomycetota bacterium]